MFQLFCTVSKIRALRLSRASRMFLSFSKFLDILQPSGLIKKVLTKKKMVLIKMSVSRAAVRM